MTITGDDYSASLPAGNPEPRTSQGVRAAFLRMASDSNVVALGATVATTFLVFAIYLIQGIVVARILGAEGRGEFGTALYFPRDILLWAGLMGAVEIVAGYAARKKCDPFRLKYSAARLGLITGVITALVAAALSILLLVPTGKAYLIPWCLVCCLFLPFEHVHLTVSAVDRGNELYRAYNINRILFAAAFPVMMLVAWMLDLSEVLKVNWLAIACCMWVLAKMVGLLPTLRGMHLLSPGLRRTTLTTLGSTTDDSMPQAGTLLKEGRPYAVSMLISEIFDRLDVFLILALAAVIDSGYYFVAVPAAAMLIIVPNALGVFTFNAGARKDVQVTRSMAAKVLSATALFQVLSALLFGLVVDDLILLFFGSEYEPAIPFAVWLLPASALKGFQQAADGYLKGQGKPLIGVYARGVSILAMLVCAALLYPRFELLSIPMSACVGQAISTVLIVFGVFHNVDEPNTPTTTLD